MCSYLFAGFWMPIIAGIIRICSVLLWLTQGSEQNFYQSQYLFDVILCPKHFSLKFASLIFHSFHLWRISKQIWFKKERYGFSFENLSKYQITESFISVQTYSPSNPKNAINTVQSHPWLESTLPQTRKPRELTRERVLWLTIYPWAQEPCTVTTWLCICGSVCSPVLLLCRGILQKKEPVCRILQWIKPSELPSLDMDFRLGWESAR